MANGLLQLRVDDELKQKASNVYSQLGLDLPSAIRIFLTRSVQVNGFPFVMRLPDKPLQPNVGIETMKSMSNMAKESGVSDMTLDEINAEIAAVRES